jgi:hypothetical protein
MYQQPVLYSHWPLAHNTKFGLDFGAFDTDTSKQVRRRKSKTEVLLVPVEVKV